MRRETGIPLATTIEVPKSPCSAGRSQASNWIGQGLVEAPARAIGGHGGGRRALAEGGERWVARAETQGREDAQGAEKPDDGGPTGVPEDRAGQTEETRVHDRSSRWLN